MTRSRSPRSITVDGPVGPLSVLLYGPRTEQQGAPLLLIHPVNTGALVWEQVAMELSEAREVVVPDLRGHGSSVKNGPFSASDYAADVLSILDQLNISMAHIAGASIGGPVGVVLATEAPTRVCSLAAFGSSLRLQLADDDLASVETILSDHGVHELLRQLIPGAIAPVARSASLIARVIAIAESHGRTTDVVLAVIRQAFATDVTGLASSCRAPSLVANGTEDATCTVGDARTMAELLGTEPVVLENVGHLPMLEVPDRVSDLILAHIHRVEQKPPARLRA